MQTAAFELPGARAYRPSASGAQLPLLHSAFVAGKLESGHGGGCANSLRVAVRGQKPLTCLSDCFPETPGLHKARSMSSASVINEMRLGKIAPLLSFRWRWECNIPFDCLLFGRLRHGARRSSRYQSSRISPPVLMCPVLALPCLPHSSPAECARTSP